MSCQRNYYYQRKRKSFSQQKLENETEIINTTVKLYDQSGNYYQFNCLSESTTYYPELLHKASFNEDENILFTYDASYNITMEYKTQKIVIARHLGFNRINSVSFYNSDKLLTKVIFDLIKLHVIMCTMF